MITNGDSVLLFGVFPHHPSSIENGMNIITLAATVKGEPPATANQLIRHSPD